MRALLLLLAGLESALLPVSESAGFLLLLLLLGKFLFLLLGLFPLSFGLLLLLSLFGALLLRELVLK